MPTLIALTFLWRIAARCPALLIGSCRRAFLLVLGLVEYTISPADIGTACSICLRSLRRQDFRKSSLMAFPPMLRGLYSTILRRLKWQFMLGPSWTHLIKKKHSTKQHYTLCPYYSHIAFPRSEVVAHRLPIFPFISPSSPGLNWRRDFAAFISSILLRV
ncbi:uncharacterized protein K441DRAFT_1839 [Cenococcum geophilum 1.58]|uniref:uncharacterized protein n=1 Tax=Cenococcum geophilum 1.58 TaxID=794803 RepID=UPI00358FD9A3|nr:hypothetical protein K441DRAFT_1839 [Cenococcum geophilum 1.58]